jgi:hypothetical protein
MFFVSKKKYDALLKQKEDFERIATNAVQLNESVINNNERILQEMRDVQILNFSIQQRNEELLVRVKELEAKLDFTIKQRDYYYDLLESTSEVEEKDE